MLLLIVRQRLKKFKETRYIAWQSHTTVKRDLLCFSENDVQGCTNIAVASLHKTERVNSETLDYVKFSVTDRAIARSTDELRFSSMWLNGESGWLSLQIRRERRWMCPSI